MTKIKICGLSRTLDIEYVNKLRPDYVGFVFAKSKRQIGVEQARELIKGLQEGIKTVGVFVNEDVEKVMSIAKTLKIKVLQFHGGETREYIDSFQEFQVWKSVGIDIGLEGCGQRQELKENQKRLEEISQLSIDGILLDSSVKGITGGTGVTFNWSIIESLKIDKPIILAGGLNPQNVGEAILRVKPYAVDVSGGVEVKGVKNYEKLKEFIDKVRG